MKNLGAIFNQIELENLKECEIKEDSVDKLHQLYEEIKEDKALMVEAYILDIIENSYIGSESIAKELLENQLKKVEGITVQEYTKSHKKLEKYDVDEMEYIPGVIAENLILFTLKNDKGSEYYKNLHEAIKIITTEKKDNTVYDENSIQEAIKEVENIENLLTEEQKQFVSKVISSHGKDLEKLFENIKNSALEKLSTKLKKEQLDIETREKLNKAEEIISNYKFDYNNLEEKFTYLYEISNNF